MREGGRYGLQMDGTPLGLRGIAAVAGGHCVGLPLKCNHSRAKASGRGSDRAKQRESEAEQIQTSISSPPRDMHWPR